MVSSNNLNTKINASFVMQAQHILDFFFLFLFLWKTYLNLYLKWAMTFRSSHLFCFFFFFWIYLFIFFEKRMIKFYLNTSKSFTFPIEYSLSLLMRALPLVSKPFFFKWALPLVQRFKPFCFILKWALPLVHGVWSIGSKIFHLLILIGLLVSLPMSLGFRASKLSQSMDGFDIFSINPITYSWSWALLLLKKIFELWPKS